MSRSRFLPALGLCLCLWAGQAHAATADLADIDRQVADFTGHGVGEAGGAVMPVDRRLRLNACTTPLALTWRTPRHDTVAVECPDPGSWHLFVPVRMGESGVQAILRGEAVMITVAGDGFAVSQPGEAMDGGAVGEWIRVRSVREGTPHGEAVRARIVRPGEVEIPLP